MVTNRDRYSRQKGLSGEYFPASPGPPPTTHGRHKEYWPAPYSSPVVVMVRQAKQAAYAVQGDG